MAEEPLRCGTASDRAACTVEEQDWDAQAMRRINITSGLNGGQHFSLWSVKPSLHSL